MGRVSAIHFYVTDLDRAIDFYTRQLGYGPQAAYYEGEKAHSAF
ncbi:MAG TPA: VOC family protein [Gaiellaceae bacterium]|nr:VOC family protein [Gaiellaceae bacterium]